MRSPLARPDARPPFRTRDPGHAAGRRHALFAVARVSAAAPCRRGSGLLGEGDGGAGPRTPELALARGCARPLRRAAALAERRAAHPGRNEWARLRPPRPQPMDPGSGVLRHRLRRAVGPAGPGGGVGGRRRGALGSQVPALGRGRERAPRRPPRRAIPPRPGEEEPHRQRSGPVADGQRSHPPAGGGARRARTQGGLERLALRRGEGSAGRD